MITAGKVAPSTGGGVPDEKHLERQLEKQMGCMTGFFQLFDRHQILSGKRVYAARRLPSSPVAGSTSPSERSDASMRSFVKEAPEDCPSSPDSIAPAGTPSRPSLPLPAFDFKEGLRSSWKLRECPRLSLDSQAVIDAKGKLRPREIRTAPSNQPDASDEQRRSPSVVARLMGLEALPESVGGGEPQKNAELRRSASESRVSRDLSRFLDSSAFQKTPLVRAPDAAKKPDPMPRSAVAPPQLQRKSFFDSRDFFPEPKQGAPPLYGEIERRLRMRGIDEPARDLETLRQILEALQLKGLLHSRPDSHHYHHHPINGCRNAVYGAEHESPIRKEPLFAAAKPQRRAGSEPPLSSRSVPARPPPRPRRGGVETENSNQRRARIPRIPDSNESARSPAGSPSRRRPVSPVKNRTAQSPRRVNGVQSPRASPRRNAPDPMPVQSPRNRRPAGDACSKGRLYAPAEDDISTVSESSFGASSVLEFEEYKTGRVLLQRCDKLLHSIAAITAAEQVTAADPQPSPVSVLDSLSLLYDESSPSPVTKRSIDFKDYLAEWEEDHWSQAISAIRWTPGDVPDPEDPEFLYVSEMIRSSDRHRDLGDELFAALEKRHQETAGRRLLFETVAEIVERQRQLSPWEAFSSPASGGAAVAGPQLLREVWAELRRVREHVAADDLNEVTCGVIRKDMAGERGWERRPWDEVAEVVLHVERQVFKDLVGNTIRELADISARSPRRIVPRRKLDF